MEQIIQDALTKGVAMHVSGEFELAGKLYGSVIKLQPNHADANHNMGLLKADTGNDLAALPYLQTALEADTSISQFWLSYIKVLIKLDRLDEASRILSLAKENGAKGEEFLELYQQLNEPTTIEVLDNTDDETAPTKPNILDTLKLDKALRLAKESLKAGSSEKAKHIYQDILKRFPKNKKAIEGIKALTDSAIGEASKVQDPPTEAITQLSNLYKQGQLKDVVEAAQELANQYPASFIIWSFLGAAAAQTSRPIDAKKALEKVTQLNPNYADGHNNFGNFLKSQGDLEGAIEALNKALALKPDYIDAYYNLGNALKDYGEIEKSIEAYNKVLALKPDYAEAYNNMGIALQDQGKLEEAIEAYNKALVIKPDYADAYRNLGIALKAQGKWEEAIEAYNNALAVSPEDVEALNSLGVALQEQGRLEESLEAFNKVLDLKPFDAEALNSMGVVIQQQGKLKETLEIFNKAVAIKPDYAEAYNNLSQAYLMNMDFKRGFELSEWRWETNQNIGTKLVSSKAEWSGEKNKRVLVYSEQGIGDVIMFASLISEIAAVSSQLIVSCDSRLIPLFERSFSKEIVLVSKDQIVPEHSYDYHIPIGSLPLTFRKELQSFKASAASYLKADRGLSQTLKNTLIEVNDKPICGITWKGGSIKNQVTRNKDISIEELGEVLKCFDYKYVSLQYGPTDTELETLKTDFGVEVECLSQIDNFSNLDGLASLISSCDYIVSVDNLTVHLAGALGVKTYVFLPFSADWRWGQDAKKSYWHSSLQLLRQKEIFNWLGPLEELRSHLE